MLGLVRVGVGKDNGTSAGADISERVQDVCQLAGGDVRGLCEEY